jgi:hypothetical protein
VQDVPSTSAGRRDDKALVTGSRQRAAPRSCREPSVWVPGETRSPYAGRSLSPQEGALPRARTRAYGSARLGAFTHGFQAAGA